MLSLSSQTCRLARAVPNGARRALAVVARHQDCRVLASTSNSISTGAASSSMVALPRRTALSLGVAAVLSVATKASADSGPHTASNGLIYEDLVEGTGPAPVKGALIRCHYTGTLASNGKVFDSSYPRGRPLSFKIGAGEVIKGWDIGILGNGEDIPSMKEGGKRKLTIPAALGYGSRGAGGVIPPNADLVFEVELLARK